VACFKVGIFKIINPTKMPVINEKIGNKLETKLKHIKTVNY